MTSSSVNSVEESVIGLTSPRRQLGKVPGSFAQFGEEAGRLMW